MRIRIEKLVYGGGGIARTEQGVVFADKVLPGELVEAEVVDRKKDYSTARLLEVIEPSSDRRAPVCPNFATVGCCGWDHIDYGRQLELKESIIREALARHGRIEWTEPIPRITGPERGYRLRAKFHVAQPARLGFVEEKTNKVIPIDRCASFMPQLDRFVIDANRALLEQRGLQGTETVQAIVSPDTGEVGATFERARERASWTGSDPRTQIDNLEYRLRADTFFQPNRYLLKGMMSAVASLCSGAETVLDLFCGSAFFSLPLARTGASVVGVDRRSVANAIWNARHNRISGAKFVKASAWAYLLQTQAKPEVVVLDPPRTGAGKNIVKRVASASPERIVYVSCNPTTFAPEARILLDSGYRITSLKFIDQFPGTPHIETIALFER